MNINVCGFIRIRTYLQLFAILLLKLLRKRLQHNQEHPRYLLLDNIFRHLQYILNINKIVFFQSLKSKLHFRDKLLNCKRHQTNLLRDHDHNHCGNQRSHLLCSLVCFVVELVAYFLSSWKELRRCYVAAFFVCSHSLWAGYFVCLYSWLEGYF